MIKEASIPTIVEEACWKNSTRLVVQPKIIYLELSALGLKTQPYHLQWHHPPNFKATGFHRTFLLYW